MTKTQINDNSNNTTTIFNSTRYKIMMFLIVGALVTFGIFKFVTYTENKKLESERAEFVELMKDDSFRARMEYFSKPNHSKEESFIFYCQMLGLKKSQCEHYNSLNKR